ncbi:MAG TPA: GNAT family protein [Chloroflexia bacterium]|nr:GNAT family protein [Chloroflexia bacterium]
MPPEDASHSAEPVINVRGERVGLGPIRRDLIPLYCRWANDFTFSRSTARSGPLSLDEMAAVYERVLADASCVSFVIYDLAGEQPIGTTDLRAIDHQHRTATFSIGIGEAAARGRGLGTEATRLVLDYAFTVLGLHNVLLEVYEFNAAGRRAYAKAGFRECGRRRESHWMGGRLWDVIYMECLASEFTSPVLGQVFTAPLAEDGG